MSPIVARPRLRDPSAGREERQLRVRVDRLLGDARALLGGAVEISRAEDPSVPATLDVLASVTHATSCELAGEADEERAAALTALGLRAQDLHEQNVRHELKQREQLHDEVEQGLIRLGRVASSAQLVDLVCAEVSRSCGFTRTLLSRVEEHDWLPWKFHSPPDDPEGPEFVEWFTGRAFPLRGVTLFEHPRPVLVTDAQAIGPPAHQPMVDASHTRAYVLAPICPAGRLIGFLHADRYPDRTVDLVDRDALWAFAEGFGRIYERTVLMERLRAQRFHIQGTLDMAETIASTLASAELELGRSPRGEAAVLEPGDVVMEAPRGNPSIDELLTSREREVLAMMVMGQANSAIAEELVIKEGTVKSHVKHILRKLGAANRVEAMSRYLEVGER